MEVKDILSSINLNELVLNATWVNLAIFLGFIAWIFNHNTKKKIKSQDDANSLMGQLVDKVSTINVDSSVGSAVRDDRDEKYVSLISEFRLINQMNFDRLETKVNSVHDMVMVHNATRCQNNIVKEVTIDAKNET